MTRKLLLIAAVLCLGGCIIVEQPSSSYVPPAPPAPEPSPAPPPVPVVTETVVYQPPPPQVAPVYQEELSPYGQWITYPAYGQCWVPSGMPYGWQPYTVGHWVYTSDGSWCWVSEGDECAWGGTVYHYGQWAFTSDAGWIWVPGTVWAPAWVAWREGGGYCGWAPLPPQAACQPVISYQNVDSYCPRQRYVYVDESNVNVTRVDQHIIRNNYMVINNTTNITNITVVNNRVINRGISVDNVRRRSGRAVDTVTVADASSPEDARRLAANGTPVHYTTPAIERVRASGPALRLNEQTVQPVRQRDVRPQNQLTRDQQAQELKKEDQEKKAELQQQSRDDRQIDRHKTAADASQAEAADRQKREKKPKPEQPGSPPSQ
jgi:hypothetical protein